jgi:hypothetical protein
MGLLEILTSARTVGDGLYLRFPGEPDLDPLLPALVPPDVPATYLLALGRPALLLVRHGDLILSRRPIAGTVLHGKGDHAWAGRQGERPVLG